MTNWQTKKLGDISEIMKGKGLAKNDIVENGKYECIHYGELFIKYNEVIKKVKSRTNIDKDVFLSKSNDVLMPTSDVTPRGLATASCLPYDGVVIGGDVLVVRPKQGTLDGRFLAYFVAGNKQAVLRLTTGSTIFHLYGSDMKKLKIDLPSKAEQERIVGVLEVWDEYIEKLEQKIALKEQLRKGLMQQLLTGKRRLPGFDDEWRTHSLEDLGDTYAGLTGKNKDDFGRGKPFITYMNIYTNSAINTHGMDLVDVSDDEKQSQAAYGDIFFTTSSETPHEVGISSVLLDKPDRPIYLNSFCFGYRMHDLQLLTPEYAEYYFRSNPFRKKMTRIAQGASRYNLSKKYFTNTVIQIPSNNEQAEIVRVLSLSSSELRLDKIKLSAIKQQKKYLLKNLITGTILTPETLKPNGVS